MNISKKQYDNYIDMADEIDTKAREALVWIHENIQGMEVSPQKYYVDFEDTDRDTIHLEAKERSCGDHYYFNISSQWIYDPEGAKERELEINAEKIERKRIEAEKEQEQKALKKEANRIKKIEKEKQLLEELEKKYRK